MARNEFTVFQRLNKVLLGDSVPDIYKKTATYNITPTNTDNQVIFQTANKEEYDQKMSQIRQEKLMSYQWVKAGADNAMDSLAGLTNVKLMYRDADLMAQWPEIGAALDILSEEACCCDSKGKILHVYSESPRIKGILEELFYNRLHINTELPMIVRDTCQYGNEFQLLNVTGDEGIRGWKKLPVYDIDRIENNTLSPYSAPINATQANQMTPDEVKFVWVGKNDTTPYQAYQVAHFRLLTDSFFLPYGVSYLHKARRAWRMLSMMEDAMLIYRLDKSIERRVFKIYVGGMDSQDVKAYVNQIANNFKRTPVIDPTTGQVDLRKNFLDVSADYFIPVRSETAPNPIETLPGAQNQTSMDDIEFMENKLLAALRIPKSFLNFQDAQGKGQNLSLMDIRFCRMVNRIQQTIILELNKIAQIHLYLLGFRNECTNFTLSLNNPSSQIESLELDELQKRIQLAATALADPGIGMPLLSARRVWKEIMKMSDAEIKDMLNEIRMEKAMAAELAGTPKIIQKTGVFDETDRIYGNPEAMDNPPSAPQQEGDEMGGGAPMGGGMPMGDGDLDMGGEGDMSGEMGETDMANAPDVDAGTPLQESVVKKPKRKKKTATTKMESSKKTPSKTIFEEYISVLDNATKKDGNNLTDTITAFNTRIDESNKKMLDTFNMLLEEIENEENDFDDEK